MVSKIYSCGLTGLNGYTVETEADISRGLPRYDVVGLPDASVKESGDRVRAAIKNSGYDYPVGKVTVNLAPGELRKEGTVYDLPIFVSILCASSQFPLPPDDNCFMGELSLDGRLRPISGVLPMTMHAKKAGMKAVFLPAQNAPEAALVDGITVYPLNCVKELEEHLNGTAPITPQERMTYEPENLASLDFADVVGQENVKRALTIAAAGFHNALLIGAPGSGKSMMAKRLPSIMPDLTEEEALECTQIYSVAGLLPRGEAMIRSRPVRSPHHSVSLFGFTGGGSRPRPGEISLAHNGILFLDELPEFQRDALEALRQPLEDGHVTISRVAGSCTYPSRFMLICAMNPCRCGYYGHPTKKCTCTERQVAEYKKRISGPLLDRIDLHVTAAPVSVADLEKRQRGESSAAIKERVAAAREIQKERYKGTGISLNSQLTPEMMSGYCTPDKAGQELLRAAFAKLGLSARGYDRILKVSRTIADLEGDAVISAKHVAEAVQYRLLDRPGI